MYACDGVHRSSTATAISSATSNYNLAFYTINAYNKIRGAWNHSYFIPKMTYWNSDITRCSSAWFWKGWGPVLDLDRDGELRRLVDLDDSFVGEILYPPLCFCCWLFPWFEFIFIEYGYINYSIPLRYRSRFHSATLPLAIPFHFISFHLRLNRPLFQTPSPPNTFS